MSYVHCCFYYIVKVIVNRFIYQFARLLYPRTSNDFLLLKTVHIDCISTLVEIMHDAGRNHTHTGGVVAIGAVCSLCLSCFSISLLHDSLCRRMPTSSVICSFISLISTSFSLTWHLKKYFNILEDYH